MQRRLLLIVVGFVIGLVLALGLPLARTSVERATQELFISRISDTAWLADAAETGMQTGRLERLRGAVRRYDRIYHVRSWVVDADWRLVAASQNLDQLTAPPVRTAVVRALAGRPPLSSPPLWPWGDDPLVVAEPIVRDNRILGAVITVSDTTKIRAEMIRPLLWIAVGGLAALLIAVFAIAIPVVRWVLRPIRELDQATHTVASGRLTARVSTREGAPELRRLATSFNDMTDSVTAVMQKQKDFIAEASHRLRNPLTALQLRLENVRDVAQTEPATEELDFALKEARRLSDMVDSMLELARVEASHRSAEVVEVTSVVRDRVEAWRTAYAVRSTPLVWHSACEVRAACATEVVEHGLDILLDNALKYAPCAAVRIHVRRENDVVAIAVADSGPGLAEAELHRAGDRFWRSSHHQNLRGTGLGLTLARTEVEPYGGSMDIRHADGQGLVVTLRVPAAADCEGTAPRAESPARPQVSGVPAGTSSPRPDAGRAGTSRWPGGDRCDGPPDVP